MNLCAEWIHYMKAYRIYRPDRPQETIAYDGNDIDVIDERVRNEYGYDGIVERDAETMHVELF